MAVSETDTSDCNSDSSIDGLKQSERKERPFTKVIIRRLPPSMNKETFLTQVSPVPDFDYMYFVKADLSLGEFAFCRAYINFKNTSDIFIFKEKFDNYVFLDAKGNEYVAVVEFAPFSRMPKKRNKSRTDPKCGSIESDPMYMDFVESLTVTADENEEKPEYCFQPTNEEEKKNVNTPLLDFIKQRRIDRQKIREEKREEKKRKEIERKRFKEEERRRRGRSDHVGYSQNIGKSTNNSKNVQILNAEEKTKDEANPKIKERKADGEYRYKSNIKESVDRRSTNFQKSNKELLRSNNKLTDEQLKKSPTKIRQRNHTDKLDSKKNENKTRREENLVRTKKTNELNKDTEDERVSEKKVKKYSERREERKNEIKKLESLKSEGSNTSSSKEIEEKELTVDDCKQRTGDLSDDNIDLDDNGKEMRENDPRTQRRIRNKDRPSMAIYQPGRGLGRQRKPCDPVEVKSDSS